MKQISSSNYFIYCYDQGYVNPASAAATGIGMLCIPGGLSQYIHQNI